MSEIDIVFDGPPSHESGRFVEVESPPGKSIRFGEWVHREDGYWVLRFGLPALLPADALARALWATVLRDRYGESDSWDDLPTCKKDAAMAVAHSVLAALGGQP